MTEKQIHEEYLVYLNQRITSMEELLDETLLSKTEIKILDQLDHLMEERHRVKLALAPYSYLKKE